VLDKTGGRSRLSKRWSCVVRVNGPSSDGDSRASGVGEQAQSDLEVQLNETADIQAGQRPALTITEAARSTGTHRNTIRRRLDAQEFPNAFRDPPNEGPWRIPVADLLTAGLELHQPDSMDTSEERSTEAAVDPAVMAQLREQVAHWRRRAQVAEAKAKERDRALKIAEDALSALNPGSPARVERPRGAEPSPQDTTDEEFGEMPPHTPPQAFNDVAPEVPVLPREAPPSERDSWWGRFWRDA
jgi:hypothetical protein